MSEKKGEKIFDPEGPNIQPGAMPEKGRTFSAIHKAAKMRREKAAEIAAENAERIKAEADAREDDTLPEEKYKTHTKEQIASKQQTSQAKGQPKKTPLEQETMATKGKKMLSQEEANKILDILCKHFEIGQKFTKEEAAVLFSDIEKIKNKLVELSFNSSAYATSFKLIWEVDQENPSKHYLILAANESSS